MRVVLKPLGIVIVLLTVCLLAGMVVFWQSRALDGGGGAPRTGFGLRSAAAGEPVGKPGTRVLLVSSATKADWLRSHIARFNNANKKGAQIEVQIVEAREALQETLNGKLRPAIWAPDSALWADRLDAAWREKNGDKALLSPSDPLNYRVVLRSPIVFLTSKDRASFLRSRLDGARPWHQICDLVSGKTRAPWTRAGGKPFRFTFTDPAKGDTGFLALAMMLAEYGAGKDAGSMGDVARSRGFGEMLAALAPGYVGDAPARSGSTDLFAAMVADPNRYDMVCTYEADAFKAAERNPKLALIYPNPTLVAEQSAALLTGAPWVTDDDRQVALRFFDLLGDETALNDGIAVRFRPLRESRELSLAPDLKRLAPQGAQQSFVSATLPPYDGINTTLVRWEDALKRAPK